MTKTIEITVTPTGETKVQTKGFIGQTCKLASAFLEKALGLVTSDKDTATNEENACHQKSQQ
jgi:hypothetical protein